MIFINVSFDFVASLRPNIGCLSIGSYTQHVVAIWNKSLNSFELENFLCQLFFSATNWILFPFTLNLFKVWEMIHDWIPLFDKSPPCTDSFVVDCFPSYWAGTSFISITSRILCRSNRFINPMEFISNQDSRWVSTDRWDEEFLLFLMSVFFFFYCCDDCWRKENFNKLIFIFE